MNVATTIRKATAADFGAIFELLEQADLATNRQLLKTRSSHSHLLVLDAPDGGLAATAMLYVKEGKASLSVLAIALRFRDAALEAELVGAADAICETFGARDLAVYRAAHL